MDNTTTAKQTDRLNAIIGTELSWEHDEGGWVAPLTDRDARQRAYDALRSAGIEASLSEGNVDSDDAGVLYVWARMPEVAS